MGPRIVWVGLLALGSALGCGPRVTFVNNERPSTQGEIQSASREHAHHEDANAMHGELPSDDEIIEPDRPAVGTKTERALVHIHAPSGMVCSGVVVGPSLVATSQQCLKGEPKGVSKLADNREYRVEIASSTLTWTVRRAKATVVPDCDFERLDAGLLVLSEPVPWVVPLGVVAAPTVGARVQALGFGHCAGEPKNAKAATPAVIRNRQSDTIVIDARLCKGDVGGPVTEGAEGDMIGLISHRDDPEGSPLQTTTIARLDTQHARRLIEQAKALASGGEPDKKAVACRD